MTLSVLVAIGFVAGACGVAIWAAGRQSNRSAVIDRLIEPASPDTSGDRVRSGKTKAP